MATQVRVHADLTWRVHPRQGQAPWRGSVCASGDRIVVSIDSLPRFSGRRQRAVLRRVIRTLQGQGLTVTINGPTGPLLALGAVRPHRGARLLPGGAGIRVLRWRGLAEALRPGRARIDLAELLPPGTPFPTRTTGR